MGGTDGGDDDEGNGYCWEKPTRRGGRFPSGTAREAQRAPGIKERPRFLHLSALLCTPHPASRSQSVYKTALLHAFAPLISLYRFLSLVLSLSLSLSLCVESPRHLQKPPKPGQERSETEIRPRVFGVALFASLAVLRVCLLSDAGIYTATPSPLRTCLACSFGRGGRTEIRESYRPAEMAHSNLRSFMKSTTPRVRPQFIPKTSIWKLNNQCQLLGGKGLLEYFTLEDLWNCYGEWSSYGAGAPMQLSNHEKVVQYYTPFLSSIQIYTAKSVNLRIVREDFEEAETDSTSSDSDAGRLSRTDSNDSNRTWDSDDSWTDPDADLKAKERLSKLYFQYFDNTSPHLRLPLKNMVDKLAEEHPGLISLRSIDLSPPSWMSVAWYPIYHIPARRNPKELYSAFLTYHTLSSSFQDSISTGRVKREEKIKNEGDAIALPPFGLATYKMQRQVWVNHQAEDRQKIVSLFSAADSWLKQLNVYHPDFSFFCSRPS